MSSLVGALLFARAVDDPRHSDAILHSMRRHLRAQFCTEPKPLVANEWTNDFLSIAERGNANLH
jgi:hypothetical protein